MDTEAIAGEVVERAKDGRIACTQCFQIAKNLNVPIKAVGDACNAKSIKIKSCQLGCFQ